MKFVSTVIAALSFGFAQAVQLQDDNQYHKKQPLGGGMWLFSGDGLAIYSADGQVMKEHRKTDICTPYMSRGNLVEDCRFYTYASDGHQYVWAGSFSPFSRVMAFDIDTGDYVGYHKTCSTPLDLEYHASRREMWLRCAAQAGAHEGELDVFSSNSIGSDFKPTYMNDTRRPYGRITVHSSMGPYGYISQYDNNVISEIDLSTREVSARYEIPQATGSYDLAFSPVNSHMFVRARVCCACGFDGADVATCGGRYSSVVEKVLVQTGQFADANPQNGTCGGSCEGTGSDTIGVVEFDTVGKTIVATHNIKAGTGFGADPVASADGKFLLLLPNDGGQYIRIMKPGQNGQPSTVAADVLVDFTGGVAGKTVISDMAFIQDERNILVVGASTDNHVVLIDLDDGYKTQKLALTGAEESTSSSRLLEWAVGTNYVWVDGSEATEVYIIEVSGGIETAKIKKTMKEKKTSQYMWVDNYKKKGEKLEAMAMMESMKQDWIDSVPKYVPPVVSESDSHDHSSHDSSTAKSNMAATTNNDSDEKSVDAISIAALIIASVALVTSSVLMVYTFSQKKESSETTDVAGDKSLSSNLKVN